jgi:haloalkane dehalogenase
MIPPLAAAGFRVLVPDLIGFGRSDKPLARSDFSYERHLRWLLHWFDARSLEDVTLFCQDWGGLLGLRIVAAQPERFARVVAANTILPAGGDPGKGFLAWLHFSQDRPCMECGKVVQGGSQRMLSAEEMAAYDAPFPDERYKAGPHVFPTLVPIRPDQPSVAENLAAWESLARFDKPFLTVFGDQDPVLGQADRVFHAKVPGTVGQPHRRIATAGHFIQEDASAELARVIIDFANA